MQNIVAIWEGMSGRRKTGMITAAVIVFLSVLAVGRLSSATNYQLLYSGLDGAAAGEVIAALDARGARYDVRGTAIFVDSRDRDRLRMSLAAEGLPAMGSQGYELLDQLSGFGTTSQMFDAAYWRAKEGELARTIVASAHIRSARVHISNGTGNPFERGGTPSAAVTVSTTSGALSMSQIRALRHLVAAAVSGLQVKDVAIIDDATGLVASGDDEAPSAGSDPMGDTLRARVERLLEARVGTGNAVVEVSVETVTERETIIERVYDPEGRVAISAEVEERSESQQGSNEGQVTVASNLPDGEAAAGAGASSSTSRESTERTNFEVSETQREIQRVPGDIRKLTVAVLLNNVSTTAADGTVTQAPRPPEELAALRGLVASAVGFDEARGDVITIESLAFEPVLAGGAPGTARSAFDNLDLMRLIQLAVAAVVALVLSLFVLRPMLTGATRPAVASDDAPATTDLPALSMASPAAEEDSSALPELEGGFASMSDPIDFGGFDTATDFGGGDKPVDRLRTLIAERQEESLQILQSWIDGEVLEPEEETS